MLVSYRVFPTLNESHTLYPSVIRGVLTFFSRAVADVLVSSDWSWVFFFLGASPPEREKHQSGDPSARARPSTGTRFTTLTLSTSAESCDTVNYGIINK